MKKIAQLTALFILLFSIACGGEPKTTDDEESEMMEAVDDAMDEMMGEEDDDENEKEISIDALPTAITDYIKANYAGAKIVEAEEETAEDGTMSIEVEIKTEQGEMDLMFSMSGEFLGVEDEDGEQEDEGDDED